MPRLSLVVAVSALAASVLATTSARADVDGAVAEGCPTLETLRARLRALLPPGVDAPDARVELRRSGARYEATIRVSSRGEDDGGERVLEGETCEAVVEASAVVLSVVARQQAEREERAPEAPAAAAARPTQLGAPPAAKVRALPMPSEASERWLALGASVGALVGTLPSPGPAVELRAAVLRRAARAEIAVAITPSQATDIAPGVGGRFSAQTVAARACLAPTLGPLRVGGCAGVEVQRIVAEGYGATRAFDRAVASWGPELGALAEWAITPRVSVRADVRAVAPLTRRAFVIDGVGTVARPHVVGVRALLGPEVRF